MYNPGMVKKFFSIISLQSFRVSVVRKLWFVFGVAALGAILYLERIGWLQQYIDPAYVRLLVVFFATYSVLSLIRFIMVTGYRRRTKVLIGERDNFVIGTDSTVRLMVIVITLASIFPIFDIPFRNFLTSISVFSVAISWLFKEYLTNFFDSYRLLYSRDFFVGDYIKVGENSKGIITDITFRATKLKTDSGDMLFIPNSTIMNTEVVNYSKVKYKRVIIPFSVPTGTVADLYAFEQYLTDTLVAQFPDLIDPEKVFLRIVTIEEGHTDCAYEVSIDTYSFTIENKITKAVFRTILAFHSNPDSNQK